MPTSRANRSLIDSRLINGRANPAQHGDDRRPADAVVGGGHAVVVCARTRHCQQVTFM